MAAVPAATSAQAPTCTLTVTLLGGLHLNFNVPAGTPLSSLSLPSKLPVLSVDQSCPTATSTGTTSTATHSATTSSTTTATTGTTTTKVKTTVTKSPAVSKARPQRASQSKTATAKHSTVATTAVLRTGGASPTKVTKLNGAGGVPSFQNPTFSFALPSTPSVGVPNFFIENFQIPPFLLPIYQAAGIEYDIPWQILASINEIETDYGRNLSISSAGAVGWMQFLPSTWRRWGVSATGNGIADPYSPVDAIFTAARYLHAAGASTNLARAIFAYNHANWYVDSVLLRARLIGGIPSQLVGALSGLVEGHFPIAAAATYADDAVQQQATRRLRGVNSGDVNSGLATGTNIYAKQGSPVVAVNDGKILKVGHSAKLGRYIVLQDDTGNVFTYSNLGSVNRLYAIPRVQSTSASSLASELSLPGAVGGAITGAASAGQQLATALKKATTTTATAPATRLTGALAHVATSALGKVTSSKAASQAVSSISAIVKQRLFAHPEIPGAYAAGGATQVQTAAFAISSFKNYFSDVLHLAKNQYTLAPLVKGSIVVAGTVLGKIGANTATQASHLYFQVQPAGKNAPLIDPKPILDGWKLLQATAIYRANGIDPFFGPGAKNPSIGEVLLMSKQQLQARIARDPHVTLDSCTARQVAAGDMDRRVLAVLEFLSVSGLDPTATAPNCLNRSAGPNQSVATADESSIDVLKVNGIPVLGHQGNGSVTDVTIRRLLTLQSSMAPSQIISLMSYKGQQTTLALPDHNNRIQIAYTPLFGQNAKLTQQITNILKPKQWINLISQISQIPEPTIPTSPSPYSIRTAG